jgi:hypothetical protein
VWEDEGSDDYYVGCQYFCVSCLCSFHLAGGVVANTLFEPKIKALTEALAIANNPSV